MAYDELGVALLKADRPAEAVKPLQEALRLDPSLIHCRYQFGQRYGQPGPNRRGH